MALLDADWWAQRARIPTPGVVNLHARRIFLLLAAPLIRLYFRPTWEGEEQLPHDRPFLLVANHSGGMAMAEIMCLMVLYLQRLQHLRIAALAHPVSFHLWPLTTVVRWLGAVPSSYQAAFAALDSGAAVLVFPGGDHEATRPFWRANEVDFNRRRGYLRIAQKAKIPIVPLGICGSHLSVPILWRSEWLLPRLLVLPRLFGIKRYPLTLLAAVGVGVILATVVPWLGWPWALVACWCWLASPLNLVPFVPVKIRFRFGTPIAPDVLFDGDDLEHAGGIVEGRVRSLVASRNDGTHAAF